LDSYVAQEPTALIFTGALGGVLRRGNFRRDTGWPAGVTGTGVPGLHLHDLRPTGNTLAAQAGTSLADLKARMGHDSVRAALIYQHATKRGTIRSPTLWPRRIEDAHSARTAVPSEAVSDPSSPG
jgi:integrase